MRKLLISGLVLGVMSVTGKLVAEKLSEAKSASGGGLIAYWSFDEAGTHEVGGDIIKDGSGQGNDGKIINAKWVKGISGSALSFEGNGYVDCGINKDFVFSEDFSAKVWVKQNNFLSQIYVSKWTGAGKGSGWYLGYWSGKVRFGCYTSSESKFVSGSDICDGNWHQIVGVRKGSRIYLYQDGNEISSEEVALGIAGENNIQLTIGNFAGGTGKWYFNGEIDEISIYSIALKEEKILKDYEEKIGIKIEEEKIKGENLILNPGFEEGLNNWSISAPYGKVLVGEIDGTISHSGRNSVKISGTKNDRISANQTIEVEPGANYRFNVWVKGENIVSLQEDAAKVRFTFTDRSNKVYLNDPSFFQIFTSGLKGTFNWRKLTMEFVIPVPADEDLGKVRCHIALFLWHGEGTVWFDDVELIKIKEGPKYKSVIQDDKNYPQVKLIPQKTNYLTKTTPVLQLWPVKEKGDVSTEIITERAKWIPKLKEYGFGTLCITPMEHNDICVIPISDEELKKAIYDYKEAGFKIILYSSLMHVGHDLSWHDVVRKHSDWLKRNRDGKPIFLFGDYALCWNPSGQAFKYCLEYTIKMVEKLNPDIVLLDNQYPQPDYCNTCQSEFKKWLSERFKEKFQNYDEILSHPSFIREWIIYSHYISYKAIEETRKSLRNINSNILLLPNCPLQYAQSELSHPLSNFNQYDYQDIVLFEKGGPLLKQKEFEAQVEKILITNALADGKPVYVYFWTWESSLTSMNREKLLSPSNLKYILANIFAHKCIPWIIAWGFDSIVKPENINQESLKVMKEYLSFFNNREIFFGEVYTKIGVFLSHSLLKGGGLLPFFDAQIPFDLIRKIDKESLKKYEVFVLIEAKYLSDKEIEELEEFIKSGKILIITENTGEYTENGARRKSSTLLERISQYNDRVICLAKKEELTSTLSGLVEKNLINVEEKGLEIIPYLKKDRIIIHYLSHNERIYKNLKTSLTLPANFKLTKIESVSPENKERINLEYSQIESKKIVNFTIPEFSFYVIVEIQ